MEQKEMELLARHLAVNAIDLSTNNREEREKAFDFFFDKTKFKSETGIGLHRNILIIGAGASNDAHRDFYEGEKLAELVSNNFFNGVEVKSLNDILAKRINKYRKLTNRKQNKFEEKMHALAHLDEDITRESLVNYLNYPYISSGFYEIVAHLFKHRYIDVIINFNFDEILDRAIKEELYNSDFNYFYSDFNLPSSLKNLFVDKKLKIPIYIKPHGTISAPSSLRFSYEQYYDLPSQMTEIIKEIFYSEYEGNQLEKDESNILPLNIIVAGFQLLNSEFNEIINSSIKLRKEKNKNSIEQLFIFDKSPRESYFDEFSKAADVNISKDKIYYKQIAEEETLTDSFYSLWNSIQQIYKTELKNGSFKGIQRHKLVADIFHKPYEPLVKGWKNSSIEDEKEIEHLEKRIYLELLILILESNGIVHLNQIQESRAGKYFTKLKEKRANRNINEFLNKLRVKSIHDYITDTFRANGNFYKGDKISAEFFAEVLKNIPERFNDKEIEIIKKYEPAYLLNVKAQYKNLAIFPFENIDKNNIINSDIRWSLIFNGLFSKNSKSFSEEDWNVLFMISETGRFLDIKRISEFITHEGIIIAPVLAHYDFKIPDHIPQILETHPYLLQPEESNYIDFGKSIQRMPWWIHNSHMILLAKVEENGTGISSPEFKKAIYYKRNMLATSVTPVYIKYNNGPEKSDFEKLYSLFISYWARSYTFKSVGGTNYEKNINIDDDLFIRTKKNIELGLKKLLDKKKTQFSIPLRNQNSSS